MVSGVKDRMINEIIKTEGGYVNDPSDAGDETNFGITKAVARVYGYTGPMQDLPRELAFNIYAAKYWDAVRADDLARLSEHVAYEVVDTGVNMGVKTAAIFLQRALNALNKQGALYGDLAVDGAIGPATLKALERYLALRSRLVLCRALNCLQGARYVELTEKREANEDYVYGWLKNRVIV